MISTQASFMSSATHIVKLLSLIIDSPTLMVGGGQLARNLPHDNIPIFPFFMLGVTQAQAALLTSHIC